ncbi:MAG: c-type cytochrome [Alphaproteobacteria bacterium]|nr:c-type cytochrome [Alphaproteobacteria bacterium]
MTRLMFACIALLGITGSAPAQDLVAGGEKVFKKCKVCHAVGDGAKNRVGPILNNVFGRPAATVDGFKYSSVMTAYGEAGLVWNEETISAYVGNPKKWLVNSAAEYSLDCSQLKKCRGKMAFAGLKKPDDVTALIAYLQTFSKENAGDGG